MTAMTTKTEVTREDLFELFGNMTVEQSNARLKKANEIIEEFGISVESFLSKVKDCKNGNELRGSVYVAKAIKEFCYE